MTITSMNKWVPETDPAILRRVGKTAEEAAEARLLSELKRTRQELLDERLRIVKLEHGVALDDMVQDTSGNHLVVCKIEPVYNGKPWVYGYKVKVDGKVSKLRRCLYSDWTVVSDAHGGRIAAEVDGLVPKPAPWPTPPNDEIDRPAGSGRMGS
ncbi:MAG: hypothetical protein KDG50_10180 [Chromatiales bacterium]|nr:hypothetical protein [Chromatiales bacterium]